MQTLKTLVVLGVLGIVGYGLYVGLNNGFEFAHVPPQTPDWIEQQISNSSGGDPTPPTIDFGTAEGSTSNPPSSFSPAAPPDLNTSATPQNGYPSPPSTTNPPAARYPGVLANPPDIQEDTVQTQPRYGTDDGGYDTYPSETNTSQLGSPLTTSLAGSTPLAGSTTPPPTDPMADITVAGLVPSPTVPPAGTDSSDGPLPHVPPADNDANDQDFVTKMAEARSKLDSRDFKAALLDLSMWYEDPSLTPDHHNELLTLLDQAAGSAIYSREHYLEPAYVTTGGESLQNVAASYGVPPGLIAKINGLSPDEPLPAGKQLKVVRGPFYGVINTEKKVLTLYVSQRYAGRFSVGVGPEFEQIVGNFVVTGKTRSHAQNPGMRYIQLGTGISESPGVADNQLAIASVTEAQALAPTGPANPPGTIQVSPKDADDLIDILSEGSRIAIRR